jgi:hypothetical protein
MMADHRDHERDFSTSDMAERSSEGEEATSPTPPPPRGRAGPPLEQPSANESTTQAPRSDLPRVEDDDASVEPLIDPEEASSLQEKWEGIQARFVDEPQRSVEQADALVAEALQRVAHSFSSGREALEGQWSRGEDVSTEDLRQIFRRYRSFFERLLSV